MKCILNFKTYLIQTKMEVKIEIELDIDTEGIDVSQELIKEILLSTIYDRFRGGVQLTGSTEEDEDVNIYVNQKDPWDSKVIFK